MFVSFMFCPYSFFIVQSIILFRYEQDTYYLNSEYLLLFSLCILLKNIKNKINYICISIILIISLFNSNISHFKSLKKNNFKSYCYIFKDFESVDGFYEYYTNKIPKNIRKSYYYYIAPKPTNYPLKPTGLTRGGGGI